MDTSVSVMLIFMMVSCVMIFSCMVAIWVFDFIPTIPKRKRRDDALPDWLNSISRISITEGTYRPSSYKLDLNNVLEGISATSFPYEATFVPADYDPTKEFDSLCSMPSSRQNSSSGAYTNSSTESCVVQIDDPALGLVNIESKTADNINHNQIYSNKPLQKVHKMKYENKSPSFLNTGFNFNNESTLNSGNFNKSSRSKVNLETFSINTLPKDKSLKYSCQTKTTGTKLDQSINTSTKQLQQLDAANLCHERLTKVQTIRNTSLIKSQRAPSSSCRLGKPTFLRSSLLNTITGEDLERSRSFNAAPVHRPDYSRYNRRTQRRGLSLG